MWRAVWLSGAILWLCGRGLGDASSQLNQAVGVDAAANKLWPDSSLDSELNADGAPALFEVHQVVVTVEEAELANPETERHLREKERLLQRMSRKHGKWNEHHPRHRLLEALRGFSHYAQTNQQELDRLKGLYSHVSKKQKALLEREVQYSKKFADIAELLARNQDICHDIVQNALEFYQVDRHELDEHTQQMNAAGRGAERISVSQALKHFVRDWAVSGANERDAAFPCITKALTALFPEAGQELVRVVLPGAGVGRLGHEIAQLKGFEVTNNEWSMYQNVAYRFLERHGRRDAHTIYPFVDSWSHHRSTADMMRPISFPEARVNASRVVLVEGDFTTVFHDDAAAFDAVVTHFFIDTARNLMSYFDTIYRILKPGGYWVNFGPLLYGTGPFVQLSLEEIVVVAEAMGFEFIEVPEGCGEVILPGKAVRGLEAVYGFDERALTKNAYNAQFWVARRRH
ncbi:Carnosine N-methyltransferase [Madurella fahalii]|uniref:Carnosine N-methyltransferase n=1 Tax=Madurella fahalii TaxID=1157608 RepID=A0ABQ0GDL7_9PEZI